MDRLECAVSVVAQDSGKSRLLPQNDVKVAVSFDIDSPGSGVSGVQNGFGQPGLRGHIGKGRGTLLQHQADASRACEREIGFEVVVEVERYDAFRCWRDSGTSSGKRETHSGCEPHLVRIGYEHRGRALSSERKRANPAPAIAFLSARNSRNRLRIESDAGIGRRRR